MPHTQMGTDTGRPLIQWRAVFGGALLGFGALLLLGSLWLALAVQQEAATVQNNIDWYMGGTAIFAMLLGGFLAGWLSGVRGIAQGIVNGASVWALVILTAIAVGVPTAFAQLSPQEITGLPGEATWATFWSLLIGLVAASGGGMLGGMIPRMTMGAAATTFEHDHEIDREQTVQRDRAEAERNRQEAQRLENESERLRQEAERRRRVS